MAAGAQVLRKGVLLTPPIPPAVPYTDDRPQGLFYLSPFAQHP